METKYRALRILSWVFRILALLLAIAGIGLGLVEATTPTIIPDYSDLSSVTFTQGPPATGLGVAMIGASLIAALLLYAFGELLQLLISTEDNTARTAHMLARMNRRRGD